MSDPLSLPCNRHRGPSTSTFSVSPLFFSSSQLNTSSPPLPCQHHPSPSYSLWLPPFPFRVRPLPRILLHAYPAVFLPPRYPAVPRHNSETTAGFAGKHRSLVHRPSRETDPAVYPLLSRESLLRVSILRKLYVLYVRREYSRQFLFSENYMCYT